MEDESDFRQSEVHREKKFLVSKTRRQTGPTGQMLKPTCISLHSMGAHQSAHMCAASKLSVSDSMLSDRLKLILAISGAGVNTG